MFELAAVIFVACLVAAGAQALASWFDRERAELDHAQAMNRVSREELEDR